MGDWEQETKTAALPESMYAVETNGYDTSAPPVHQRDEAKVQAAREAGWVEAEDPDVAAGTSTNPSNALWLGDNDDTAPAWMHKAAKYEWKEEYGDVGPEVPELEKLLYGSQLRVRKGGRFDN